jgi:hypothetical protein
VLDAARQKGIVYDKYSIAFVALDIPRDSFNGAAGIGLQPLVSMG